MLRPGSLQLARVFGIRIGVNTSWFFVLFFLIWYWSGVFGDELGGASVSSYLVAVAVTLGFFASLVLHELGHALAARRSGIQVAGIDLWFFGGIARMSRDTSSPGEEFRVAVAGPLVTLALAVAFTVAGVLDSSAQHFTDVAFYRGAVRATPVLLALSWLALINVALLAFNLIPAFPLDGGRLARALAWRVTDDKNRGTRASARLGQAFGYLLSAAGLFLLLSGDVADGLWFGIMGWFLGQAARGAVIQTAFSERLAGMTVADIMDPEPVAIPGDLPLLQAEEEFFLRYRWPWFVVVDEARHYLGVLRRERVDEEIAAGRPALPAREAMEDGASNWRIALEAPLEAVLGSEAMRRLGAVAAVDGDGVLCGVVTVAEVRRALTPITGV